jgi:hypothetical protein
MRLGTLMCLRIFQKGFQCAVLFFHPSQPFFFSRP